MKNTKRVISILDKYPKTRSDDHLLFIKYLQEYYCNNKLESYIIEKILSKAPLWSSITRERAHLQNNLWEYLPWEWCRENRRKKAQRIRQEYREKSIVNRLKSYFPIFK